MGTLHNVVDRYKVYATRYAASEFLLFPHVSFRNSANSKDLKLKTLVLYSLVFISGLILIKLGNPMKHTVYSAFNALNKNCLSARINKKRTQRHCMNIVRIYEIWSQAIKVSIIYPT